MTDAMRELELFRLDSLPAEVPFSSAVRVGDTVYVSGQIGHRPGEMRLVEDRSINHTQKFLGLAFVSALFVAGAGVAAAERTKASVECKSAEQRLVYDCTIMLTGRKNIQPIDGAKIVVGAEMPSMPMAHNVKPVTAVTTGKPGMYRVRIELEMYGEWALIIDVSGPTRDRIIHKTHFGDGQSEDASQGPAPQFYESVGVVIKVDKAKSRVTLDHEEIKGYMAAMVMSYLVTRRELLKGLEAGNKVRFTVDADKRAIINIIRLGDETN